MLSIRIVIATMVALIGILCLPGVLSIRIVIIALVTTIGILYLTAVVYHGCDYCLGNYNWYFIFDYCCLSWL